MGFLIHKRLAGNVVEVKGVNDRICMATVQLNQQCKMDIIQVYAPTASHDDATVEAFYNIQHSTTNTLEICKGKLTYIIGGFNAKVGMKDQDERKGCREVWT